MTEKKKKKKKKRTYLLASRSSQQWSYVARVAPMEIFIDNKSKNTYYHGMYPIILIWILHFVFITFPKHCIGINPNKIMFKDHYVKARWLCTDSELTGLPLIGRRGMKLHQSTILRFRYFEIKAYSSLKFWARQSEITFLTDWMLWHSAGVGMKGTEGIVTSKIQFSWEKQNIK